MRAVGWLIALLSALSLVGGETSATVPPPLVTFGHSYAAGDYAASAPEPWPARLAAADGRLLDNRAKGGTESPAIAQAVDRYAPRASDDVVIEAALNDARDRGRAGVPRYAMELRRMLAHLTSGTRPHRIVVVLDPPIPSADALDAYRGPTEALARGYGARFTDLGEGWDPALIGPDGIHPSPAGAEHIARAVGRALR